MAGVPPGKEYYFKLNFTLNGSDINYLMLLDGIGVFKNVANSFTPNFRFMYPLVPSVPENGTNFIAIV
jgi:hypothetical protein